VHKQTDVLTTRAIAIADPPQLGPAIVKATTDSSEVGLPRVPHGYPRDAMFNLIFN